MNTSTSSLSDTTPNPGNKLSAGASLREALCALRPPFTRHEAELHQMVEARLLHCGYAFEHEAIIAKGCRIDYLVGDIGIEIKKGRPNPKALTAQLARYAASERIAGLIVVSWQSVRLPTAIGGKEILPLVLSNLWGVSLL